MVNVRTGGLPRVLKKSGDLGDGEHEPMTKKVLVATDGSDHARKAIDYACDLASKYDAVLYLVHVIHRSGIPKRFLKLIEAHRIEKTPENVILQEIGDRIVKAAEREAKKKGLRNFQTFIIEGDPA